MHQKKSSNVVLMTIRKNTSKFIHITYIHRYIYTIRSASIILLAFICIETAQLSTTIYDSNSQGIKTDPIITWKLHGNNFLSIGQNMFTIELEYAPLDHN
jgi:hypothetical protein